jgi:hypothetical protein
MLRIPTILQLCVHASARRHSRRLRKPAMQLLNKLHTHTHTQSHRRVACRKMDHVVEHLYHELTAVRTGRASPALLDSVNVDAFGDKQNLSHVATIIMRGPRTLVVTVYDHDTTASVLEAIRSSPLQLSPRLEGGEIIVNVPECAPPLVFHGVHSVHSCCCA